MKVRQQAGGIVFRGNKGNAEILVIRAKKNPGHWIFPKGHIERGETAAEAAVREVREEAGVDARVVKPVHPAIEFEIGAERIHVQYYLLAATGGSGKGEKDRDPRWCAPDAALEAITHDDARALLRGCLADIP